MRKIQQKANPNIEFRNDPLMRELHEIRMKMYKETKKMNGRQLSTYFRRKSEEFRKDTG